MKKYFRWALTTLLATSLFGQGKLGFNPKDMDLSVKPSDDFYLYANGGWLKSSTIPSDKSRWGSFNELAEQNRSVLMSIVNDLNSNKKFKVGSNEQRVFDFYSSGMNTDLLEKIGTAPMNPYLAIPASLKDHSDLPRVLATLHKVGFPGVFSMGVGTDAKNSNRYMVSFGQGGITLPDRDFYLKEDDRSKNIRDKFVPHVAKMFMLSGDSPDQAMINAQVVMTVETKIALIQMSRVEMRDPNKRYNLRTAKTFQEEASGFDWSTYLRLRNVSVEDFNVAQPSFFKSFTAQINSISIEDWKTYLRWHVVNSSANSLTKAFEAQAFSFGRVLSGVQVQESRDKRMVAATDQALRTELGQLYVARAFSPQAKKKVLEMVANIRAVLRERIQNLEWMGEDTKKQAIRKLDSFVVKMAYPDVWEKNFFEIKSDDYYGNLRRLSESRINENITKLGKPVDRTVWGMTPPTVNAYYSPSLNEIVFPAGILQKPFFDPSADDAVNYGAIGWVIGHEITHGFDDSGSQFDADGNLKNWWTPEDRKAYDQRANLVVEQFNAYEPIKGERVNGKLTLGENIADLGGMKIAYAAWQKSLKGKPSPVIEGFTGAQRFFIGGATIWRQLQREEAAFQQLKTDSHSPGQYRVIGPMSNLPAFYEAFNCPVPSPMVRDEKVRPSIW